MRKCKNLFRNVYLSLQFALFVDHVIKPNILNMKSEYLENERILISKCAFQTV